MSDVFTSKVINSYLPNSTRHKLAIEFIKTEPPRAERKQSVEFPNCSILERKVLQDHNKSFESLVKVEILRLDNAAD